MGELRQTRDRIVDIVEARAGDLVPNPRNWRTHPESQRRGLESLLERVGSVDVLKAVRLPDGRLQPVDGHLRAEVRRDEVVRVAVLDLTPEEADLVLATFDPVSAMAGADIDVLRGLLDDVRLEVPEDVLVQLEALCGPAPAGDPGPDPDPPVDRAAELREEWGTARGQVWEIPSRTVRGCHRIVCGDAVTACAGLEPGFSLLVTDPPYGVSYADKNDFLSAIGKPNHVQTHIENDHAKPSDMSVLWVAAFTAARALLAPGASYYVTGPQGGELLLLLMQALNTAGFPLRHMLIWAKNNHVLGRCDYNYKHEPILFGWVEGSHRFYGPTNETSLWQIDKPNKSDMHPTTKPVELYARAIRNSTARGERVLDIFAGSGTCLIAAEQEGRIAECVEITGGYTAVILERARAEGLEPRLVETPF